MNLANRPPNPVQLHVQEMVWGLYLHYQAGPSCRVFETAGAWMILLWQVHSLKSMLKSIFPRILLGLGRIVWDNSKSFLLLLCTFAGSLVTNISMLANQIPLSDKVPLLLSRISATFLCSWWRLRSNVGDMQGKGQFIGRPLFLLCKANEEDKSNKNNICQDWFMIGNCHLVFEPDIGARLYYREKLKLKKYIYC